MERILASIIALLLLCAGDGFAQTGPSSAGESALTEQDKEIIQLMEMLNHMDLLSDMELLEDFDVLTKEEDNKGDTDDKNKD